MKYNLIVTIKGYLMDRSNCAEYSETYRLFVYDDRAMIQKELNRAFERYCGIKEIKFEVEKNDIPSIEPKTAEQEIAEALVEDLEC